jgi:hypothetical protein
MRSAHERTKTGGIGGPLSHDPLRSARSHSDEFNRTWLTSERPLTGLQRIGFAVLSLGFVSAGLWCAEGSLEAIQDSDLVWTLLWTIGAAGFIFLGVLGLVRVFRAGRGGKA